MRGTPRRWGIPSTCLVARPCPPARANWRFNSLMLPSVATARARISYPISVMGEPSVGGTSPITRSAAVPSKFARYEAANAIRTGNDPCSSVTRASIDDLVTIVASIADKVVKRRYDLTKPQGVRGSNRDNSRLREALAWVLQLSLERGLGRTNQLDRPSAKKMCPLIELTSPNETSTQQRSRPRICRADF